MAKNSRAILSIHSCINIGLLGCETVQFGRLYQHPEKTCCLHFLLHWWRSPRHWSWRYQNTGVSLGYTTDISRQKCPQILPNQTHQDWRRQVIHATVLSASNLFYLRSTEHYFHTHTHTHTGNWNFSFSRITKPLSKYLKFGHHDENQTERQQCTLT